MSLRKTAAIALAGLLSVGAAAALAQDFVVPDSVDEIVKMRQALMKEDGGILRGAGNLAGDEAVAAMEKMLVNFGHIPALFPEGSDSGADTKALPAIWQNWDEFQAIVETGKTAIQSALDAAKAGDTAAYTAALRDVGQTCGQCHSTFRAK